MGGSATVAVVPNRGTAKARLPVRFKYIIRVIWFVRYFEQCSDFTRFLSGNLV